MRRFAGKRMNQLDPQPNSVAPSGSPSDAATGSHSDSTAMSGIPTCIFGLALHVAAGLLLALAYLPPDAFAIFTQVRAPMPPALALPVGGALFAFGLLLHFAFYRRDPVRFNSSALKRTMLLMICL